MARERIKVEAFRAVVGNNGVSVSPALAVVSHDTDRPYVDPTISLGGGRFAPLPAEHQRLYVEGLSERYQNFRWVSADAFDIHPNALERPRNTRSYRMEVSPYEESHERGAAALIAIVNHSTRLEAQRVANEHKRRIDLFAAGRRLGDPIVDVLFLKENEEVFAVTGVNPDLFTVKALRYRPKESKRGIIVDEFGPEFRGKDPESPPDGPKGGGSDREPRTPIPRIGSGAAEAEIPEEEPFSSHPAVNI